MSVSCDFCVLSGRVFLCRADHSFRGVLPTVCVSECDRETSLMGRSWPTGGCCTMKKNYKESQSPEE